MATVVASIVYGDVPGFPAGTAVDHIAVSISNNAVSPPVPVSQNVAGGTTSVSFANVDAGDYSYAVMAVDAGGNTLGTAVTGTFAVAGPATVTLSLPQSAAFAAQ